MKALTDKAKKRIRIYAIFLFVGIVAFSCVPFVSVPVKADYVTDNIGVKVGYAGRELKDYVLVGDYHISEIEAKLPVYEYAYSFYQANTMNPAKYNYIVDSARGILVKDLLDYANIYYGDIYNLNFWVQDHSGMWCAFDRDSLFAGNRYYFNNLPGHRKILYKTFKKLEAAEGIVSLSEAEDEPEEPEPKEPESKEPEPEEPESKEPEPEEPESKEPEPEEPESKEPEPEEPESKEPEPKEPESKESESKDPEEDETVTDYAVILGYDFSECWTDCSTVPAMLAIEDNWASFNEEFESAGPNFTTLNTSSRFRLLYGQFSPTDSNTRDSAKYVRYVYVTLAGAPQFVKPEQTKPLNNKIGATDTLEFEVSDIYNEDMADMLTKYMSVFSTDESVIRIENVEVKKIAEYSDRAKVEVTYKVVGEGEATIGGTFGSYNGNPDAEDAGLTMLTGTVKTEKASGGTTLLPDPEEKETKAPQKEKTDTDPQKETETADQEQPGSGTDGDSHQISGQDKKTSLNKEAAAGTASASPDNEAGTLETAEHKVVEAEELKANKNATYVYRLSDDLVKKLEGLQEEDLLEPIAPVTQEVQQLELEDRSEEEKERRKRILIWTGAGCLAVCAAGAAAETGQFPDPPEKTAGKAGIGFPAAVRTRV